MTGDAASEVVSSVVNNSGVIEAKSLVKRGGTVRLVGRSKGIAQNCGTIDVSADGPAADAGEVSLTGDLVAQIGTILADGDVGADAGSISITSSSATVVGAGSTTSASGQGDDSDGGDILIASATATTIQPDAALEATGGATGDGGLIKVGLGDDNVRFETTHVDASASDGEAGTLFIDPEKLTIADGGASPGDVTNPVTFDEGPDESVIHEETLEAVAADHNIVLQAKNEIVLEDLSDGELSAKTEAGKTFVMRTRNAESEGDSKTGGISFEDTDDTIATAGGNIRIEAGYTPEASAAALGTVSAGAEAVVSIGNLRSTGGAGGQDGDIAVKSTAGDVPVGNIDAGTAAVTVTAGGGAITDGNANQINVTAGELSATAAGGIDLDTTVTSLDASTTATGDVVISETDDITLTNVSTADGSITLTSGGQITATNVDSSGTDHDTNDIALTSTGGGIAAGTANAGATGDVTLDAQGGAITDQLIGTNVHAKRLFATAGGGIDLDTQVSRLELTDTGGKAITIDTRGAVTPYIGVTTSGGRARIWHGGSTYLSFQNGELTAPDAVTGLIALRNTNGDVTVDTINGNGRLEVSASNDIRVNKPLVREDPAPPDSSTALITLKAGRSVLLNADVTVAGRPFDIWANQPDLGVGRATGPGEIVQKSGTKILKPGTGRLLLAVGSTSTGGFEPGRIVIEDVGTGSSGEGFVYLHAPGGITETDADETVDITAGYLGVKVLGPTAGNTSAPAFGAFGGAIETDVGGFYANVTDRDILLDDQSGGLRLRTVNAGTGMVSILARGGAITAENGYHDAINVVADSFAVAAEGGIDLNTEVGTLDASATEAGDISISEIDDITLTDVSTSDGSISVAAGGGIRTGIVNAGPERDVTLEAKGGSIEGINGDAGYVVADHLQATAQAGIDLDTTVASLTVEDTGGGAIDINEDDDLSSISVKTADGDVTVAFGGDKHLTFEKPEFSDTRQLDAYAVGTRLAFENTAGSIGVANVNVGKEEAVSLGASGAIEDRIGWLTADSLSARAAGGIDLDTRVRDLAFTDTGGGTIRINAGWEPERMSVTTENGVAVIADCEAGVKNGVVTIPDGGKAYLRFAGGALGASATGTALAFENRSGDIEVGEVNVGSEGSVTLNAPSGAITDDGGYITANSLHATASGGIGAPGGRGPAIDTKVYHLTLTDTGGSGIYVNTERAPLSVSTTTNNGDVIIEKGSEKYVNFADGELSASSTGCDLTFRNTGGDIVVGEVNVEGASVAIEASGAIRDDGGAVAADKLTAIAAGGIGTPEGGEGGAIDADVKSLVVTDTGGNEIYVNGSGWSDISVTTKNGDVFLGPGGDCVKFAGGKLTADAAGTTLTFENTNGDIGVGSVYVGNGSVTLNAPSGAITDGNSAGVNVSANELAVTARDGIDLDANADSISATTNGGDVSIRFGKWQCYLPFPSPLPLPSGNFSLDFTSSDDALSITGPSCSGLPYTVSSSCSAITFRNTGGDVVLGDVADFGNFGDVFDVGASNDLTVGTPITFSGPDTGGVTLKAGRSVNLNADITVAGAPLDIFANQTGLGVGREPGAGEIVQKSGTKINMSSARLYLEVGNKSDGGFEPGGITIDDIESTYVYLTAPGGIREADADDDIDITAGYLGITALGPVVGDTTDPAYRLRGSPKPNRDRCGRVQCER